MDGIIVVIIALMIIGAASVVMLILSAVFTVEKIKPKRTIVFAVIGTLFEYISLKFILGNMVSNILCILSIAYDIVVIYRAVKIIKQNK